MKVLEKHLKKLKKQLNDHKPPSAKYYKNDKTITVKYGFNLGFIPKIKIKASSEQWLKWNDVDNITFDDIKSSLIKRIPQNSLKDLKQYAEIYPENFSADVYHCVDCANASNPLNPAAAKPRGGSPYPGFTDKKEMWEIRSTARHLYVFLRSNKKNINRQMSIEILVKGVRLVRSASIKELFIAYGLRAKETTNIRLATMLIIKKAFGFPFSSVTDGVSAEDMFYRNYIAYLPLQKLRESKRIIAGNSHHLKKNIFPKILS